MVYKKQIILIAFVTLLILVTFFFLIPLNKYVNFNWTNKDMNEINCKITKICKSQSYIATCPYVGIWIPKLNIVLTIKKLKCQSI